MEALLKDRQQTLIPSLERIEPTMIAARSKQVQKQEKLIVEMR